MEGKVKVGIYVRVSTEEQAKEGFSINAQKDKLKQYALVRDWDIYDIYIDDGKSGKNLTERPEVLRLIQDVEDKKINSVLVYRIDRLTRSMKNLLELLDLFQKKDCSFNSLMEAIDTSSGTGRMFLKIVGIFVEFERENLAERVSFGYEQKAKEGQYTAKHVYGYDYIKGQGMIVNEQEKAIINDIFNWYLNGMSFSRMVKKLKDTNVPTKKGGKWHTAIISRILTNSLYIGKMRYKVNPKDLTECELEVEVKNVEPIISEEVFYNAQQIYKQRRKNQSRSYPRENVYFNGTLYCGLCGRKMNTRQHRDTTVINSPLYVSYRCCQEDCKTLNISQMKIETAFSEYIKGFTLELNDLNTPHKEEISDEESQLKNLTKELQKYERRNKYIRELFLQEKLNIEEYRKMSDELDLKIIPLQERISDISITSQESYQQTDPKRILKAVNHFKLNWEYLSNQEKATFMHKFVKEIKVEKANGVVQIKEISFYDL